MRLGLLFLLIANTALTPAFAEEESYVSIDALLQTIDGINRNPPGHLGDDCPPEGEAPRTSILKRIESPRFEKVEDQIGEQIEISVLTEEKASDLFRRLRQEKLGLKNDVVCAQRAHLMSLVMEQEGVISGKIFVKPGWFGSIVPDLERNKDGRIRWDYHVAPFIYVEKDGKIEQWVIDPLLFDKPVPRSEWEKVLSSHPKSSFGKAHLTRRFIYRPSHMHDSSTSWKSSELVEARDILDRANSVNFRP